MAPRPFSPWRWWAAAGASFVLVLLVAPAIYRFLVDAGSVDPTDVVGGDPYGKVLRRLLTIPLLIGVLGALRPWRDVTWAGMGLKGPRARPRMGLTAWAVTVGCMLALLAFQGLLGWVVVEVDDRPGRVVQRILRTLASGAVVGVIEELLFRAWLPLRLARSMGAGAAAVVSVAIYAVAHAFRPTAIREPLEVSTQGALDALGAWLRTLADPSDFGPACLGLALFGALLLALYRRTGTLWAPIGVHAAAVWVLFGYGAVTNRRPAPEWAGTKLLYDGPLGWALLVVALLLVLRVRRAHAPAAPPPPAR